MGVYATEHRDALADIKAAGVAVTFTSQGRTYNATAGTSTVSTTTVTGYAMRVRGNPKRYEALGLVEAEAPTLLFAPTTYGDEVALGATCTWGGGTFTVRDVSPVGPDGDTIVARVVVSR